ncbi:MAG: decarboxylating 6-phosphogluconate dehydrogenase [Bacteroidetes bacterium]|nr:decarboxylating 6-phosphogluconate dehydrogenase [Bacteroidota bacterium]
MQLGFIGLGKMGGFMVQRLLRDKHDVVGFDLSADVVKSVAEKGMTPSTSMEDMIGKLKGRKAVWVMVPAGKPTEDTIAKVAGMLSKDDIIIDGGNTFYKDDIRRAEELKSKGIHYVDVGTSGGVWGLSLGYCMMIGGEKAVVEYLDPIFKTLGPVDGYAYMGASGSGHMVKMVHNGIEYGLMQAYAEGFEIMQASPYNLDLAKIADLWGHASVVRSWLLELTADGLKKNPTLDGIKGWVADSGEGRWTVMEAIERDVPAPVITASLFERFHSRRPDSFAAKMLAMVRNQFGGHAIKK